MTISNTRSFAEIITDQNSRLGRLIHHAKQLEKMTELFRTVLDTDLTKHCNVTAFDGKNLALIVDSAAWGTRLRYAIPDMIKTLKFQPEFQKIEKINYRVKRN